MTGAGEPPVRQGPPRPTGPSLTAGSRRHRARGDQWGRSGNLLLLKVICAPDGWPDHGEQEVLRVGRIVGALHLPARESRDDVGQLLWPDATRLQQDPESGQWYEVTPAGELKTTGRCPKCRANPQLSPATIGQMLDVMNARSGGAPLTWRWDFRRQRLLE